MVVARSQRDNSIARIGAVGISATDYFRKPGYRRMIENSQQRNLRGARLANSRDRQRCLHRVAAESKKIIVHADSFHAEQVQNGGRDVDDARVAGGSAAAYALIFGIVSLLLQIYVPYRRYARYLKWLTWSLLAYVITAFIVHIPWAHALKATFIPSISYEADYLMALIAVLGTTISPYLFFWQTSQEVEEVKVNAHESRLKKKPFQALEQFRRIAFDTRVGMAFSNVVAFFIILTSAATLHSADPGAANHIRTAADAAKSLQPFAGHFAFLLFALGIVGTGMLAIPVLAGSAAYAVSEIFGWRASLESKPNRARKFYALIAVATLLGVGLTLIGLDPIHALFLAALINGLVAVPLMALLMMISVKPAIVGEFHLPLYLRIVGWAATALMAAASLGFLASGAYQALHR